MVGGGGLWYVVYIVITKELVSKNHFTLNVTLNNKVQMKREINFLDNLTSLRYFRYHFINIEFGYAIWFKKCYRHTTIVHCHSHTGWILLGRTSHQPQNTEGHFQCVVSPPCLCPL